MIMIGEDHLHITEKGMIQKYSLVVHRTLMIQPQKINIINLNKKLPVWEIGLKPFNYRCLETKILLLLRRTPWSKVSNAF